MANLKRAGAEGEVGSGGSSNPMVAGVAANNCWTASWTDSVVVSVGGDWVRLDGGILTRT